MRINWNIIKLILLSICITALYGFTNHRSEQRKVASMAIQFIGDNNVFITEAAVNKLLIQNYGPIINQPKERVDLNTIEKLIQANKMVKKAQVYLTLDGELRSKIEQRQPLGRIEGVKKFYLDKDGKSMPLSPFHSARVPIITGHITGETLEDAYTILTYINTDEFLRKNVIGIHIEDVGNYQLKFRVNSFVVHLGDVENLEQKFSKFKAFYTKGIKDKSLDSYQIVSLEYDDQVVCTKI